MRPQSRTLVLTSTRTCMDDDCSYEEIFGDTPLLGDRRIYLPRWALGSPIPTVLTVTFEVAEVLQVRNTL